MNNDITFHKVRENVGIITLNRPHVHHALSLSLLKQFQQIILDIKEDIAIRVVVITGSGEKSFCAGADLKERATMTEDEARKAVTLIRDTINMVEQLPMPVIAALNGSAFGGGLELALACDIRIGCEDIQLGLTETALGIIPGAGGTQRLPRLIGSSRAKELIYTAKRMNAQEAYTYGILQHVYRRESFTANVYDLCEQIEKNAPLSLRAAKFAIDKGVEVKLEHALYVEQLAYERIIKTQDRLEGLLAFKEKRNPQYKGV